jgi:hypothetical protein
MTLARRRALPSERMTNPDSVTAKFAGCFPNRCKRLGQFSRGLPPSLKSIATDSGRLARSANRPAESKVMKNHPLLLLPLSLSHAGDSAKEHGPCPSCPRLRGGCRFIPFSQPSRACAGGRVGNAAKISARFEDSFARGMGIKRQLRTGARGKYRKIVGGVEAPVENCRITAGADF